MKKDTLKAMLLQTTAGAVVMLVLGLVLLLCPDLGSAAVGAVVGWVLIGLGAIGALVGVLSWPVMGLGSVICSVCALVFGICVVNNPLVLASVLGFALGIYLLIQSISYLRDALRLKKIGAGYHANLALGIVMLLFGMMLLPAPLKASQLLMRAAGIALMVCGGASLLVRSRTAARLNQGKSGQKPKIIDADE